MNGQYPRFKNSYFYEQLTENFLLTPAELEFVRNYRGDANRQGMAILLKGLQYLGYFNGETRVNRHYYELCVLSSAGL